MATADRSRIKAVRPAKQEKASPEKVEEDFLAGVMTSVSASLEAMSENGREHAVAVAAAEQAVAHLQ